MKKLMIKKTTKSLSESSTLNRGTLKNFKGGLKVIEDPISEGGCNADALCSSGRSIWNNFSGTPHTNCCA
ncbi:hypothetical protein [Chryseobacterium sp.]|uniref:hypothetical protein n=1 Tax=Chryseobacterium sp. TaxID=1871047 RepID=UPI0025BF72AE|nr:hypothetical protein [Chryseobacterium sp.]MBV8327110.1 hypothetical protein [Chryseobacterium sp.]